MLGSPSRTRNGEARLAVHGAENKATSAATSPRLEYTTVTRPPLDISAYLTQSHEQVLIN